MVACPVVPSALAVGHFFLALCWLPPAPVLRLSLSERCMTHQILSELPWLLQCCVCRETQPVA